MYKKYYNIIISLLFAGCSVSLLFFAYSCRCDEEVYMAVMAGARDEKSCEEMREKALNDELANTTYACPGDTVTICWGGNVANNIIEPVIGSVGQFGAEQIVVTSTMTIKITPQGSCASPKEFQIIVLNGETPTSWDAHWVSGAETNKTCDYLLFKISPFFMSSNIQVVKVTAKFQDTDATNSPCNFPPFLTGTNSMVLGGFTLNKPFEQVTLSTPYSAVGDWKFDFFDNDCKRECKPDAVLPFELILKCPDKQ